MIVWSNLAKYTARCNTVKTLQAQNTATVTINVPVNCWFLFFNLSLFFHIILSAVKIVNKNNYRDLFKFYTLGLSIVRLLVSIVWFLTLLFQIPSPPRPEVCPPLECLPPECLDFKCTGSYFELNGIMCRGCPTCACELDNVAEDKLAAHLVFENWFNLDSVRDTPY